MSAETPRLHARHPELATTVPHTPLGSGPTPVRRLDALEPAGTELWIKDDGAYGDGGWGGNKVRKLEWILAEAKRRRARTILTVGGLGTNWGLATALYGREHGIATALMLVDQPVDEHVRAQQERLAASGAALHYTHTKARTIAALPWLALRHTRGGRPPYLQPAGGSSAVGALGYVEAAYEIAEQVETGALPMPSHVVATVGSGGTAAGLALGLALAGLPTAVMGIVVNDSLRLDTAALTRLAGRTAKLLVRRGARIAPGPLRLESLGDWMGPGYGHSTPEAAEAIAAAATAEGLTLDPVYTSKTMAAVLAMGREGRLGSGPVLYLHTDGPR